MVTLLRDHVAATGDSMVTQQRDHATLVSDALPRLVKNG